MEKYDRNNLIVVDATIVTAIVDAIGLVGSVIVAAGERYAWMLGFWIVCLLVSGGYFLLLWLFREDDPPKS